MITEIWVCHLREGLSFTLTANSKDDNTIAIVANSYSSSLGFTWTWNISLYTVNGKHFKKAGIGYFYRKRDAQSDFAQLRSTDEVYHLLLKFRSWHYSYQIWINDLIDVPLCLKETLVICFVLSSFLYKHSPQKNFPPKTFIKVWFKNIQG